MRNTNKSKIYSNESQETLFKILVCVDITTKRNAALINAKLHLTWKFGTCSSNKESPTLKISVQRCCLAPGLSTLECNSFFTRELKGYYDFNKVQYPHTISGWYKGYIKIQGMHYCDDYVGYKAMRGIHLQGNLRKYVIFLEL